MLDGFDDHLSALHQTVMGILTSDAADKGVQIAGALEEFTASVLRVVEQAGLRVPTRKRGSILIPEHTEAVVLKTARLLAPTDILGAGMRAIDAALQEIQGWVGERRGAA